LSVITEIRFSKDTWYTGRQGGSLTMNKQGTSFPQEFPKNKQTNKKTKPNQTKKNPNKPQGIFFQDPL